MRRLSIHLQPDWPRFFWDEAKIGPALAAVRHKQGRLLGRMEGLGFSLRSEATLSTLTADVVQSSAIEGEHLDPQEVRSSIARRLGLDIAGLPPASRSVEGIVEILLDATQRFAEPLTDERLLGWHAALFPTGRSGTFRITVGDWRRDERGPMQVVSGPMGKERVHFEAPEASRLAGEMSQFLAWFESMELDSVLKAALAHLWFVTIHPFDDGNGRIARAIADLALARSDGSRERFYSMSAQIERERKEYYRQLEDQQHGTLDITRWMAWFLACLERAIDAAESALGGVLFKARFWSSVNRKPVHERQRTVLNRMLSNFEGALNSSKYSKLAKCSHDTALRDIRELVARGILVRNDAGGRSTSYRLGEPDGVTP